MRFADRLEAGQKLARYLRRFRHFHPEAVLVSGTHASEVGTPVANALGIPAYIVPVEVVRAPQSRWIVLGATSSSFQVFSETTIELLAIERQVLTGRCARAAERARRKEARLSQGDQHWQSVLIVDDGMSHPLVLRTLAGTARMKGASELQLAMPLGALPFVGALQESFDRVHCLALTYRATQIPHFYRPAVRKSEPAAKHPISDDVLLRKEAA